MRDVVRAMIEQIEPLDDLEAHHRTAILDWIGSGVEIYRQVKPATPPIHLVSYCALVDPHAHHMLLIDHRDARLWLPPGGHVEPGEDPAEAAVREIEEELGISPAFSEAAGAQPLFVTKTQTQGVSESHTDVSLWFVFDGSAGQAVTPDLGEFVETKWWAFDEIATGDPAAFDPHLARFVAKLRSALDRARTGDSALGSAEGR